MFASVALYPLTCRYLNVIYSRVALQFTIKSVELTPKETQKWLHSHVT
jgi:hypothetical protein